ncbi:integrase arm-type DNA-binding domain-containing protein [Pelagibacterium luteolum]|uniref:Core-binding (CB) domain-containing protein n=1 Tax=Pelagibacterium luteolum TaxID=440168 RepID=A0A1G7YLE3_9HYPH|nr:integrase arm-type DNA-binding domain-containing protein [Pelagibacterium luteolum]SDG97166.1 hypothetical protein SAMN04487974_11475 [Pelagibacterium luteolum]
MAALQISLSDTAVSRLVLAEKGQYVVRDTDLKGFFVVVGTRHMTFMVRAEHWENGKRKAVQAKVGRVGEIKAREARSVAKEYLGRIARGEPLTDDEPDETEGPTVEAQEPPSVTLHEAWERYRDSHLVRKGRSARTIESYADHVTRLFADWKDQSLLVLGNEPALVADRHNKITRENGPYVANGAMRTLRAIYNHARKTHRYLPADNPVDAIDWNEEERRNTGMGLKDLPKWFGELFALDNPIRREFHLFSLLSGCRPGALKVAEIGHLDFRRRLLHIPAPKGGAKKAFDIPLSPPMIRCLIRAIRCSRIMHPFAGRRWIFAADSHTGHIAEQKEDRDKLSKWANELRQTFRTVGQAAGVPELDIHILMNHALQGANAGYITTNRLLEDHLRGHQACISATMLEALRTSHIARRSEILGWLETGRIAVQDRSAAPDAASATVRRPKKQRLTPRRARRSGPHEALVDPSGREAVAS